MTALVIGIAAFILVGLYDINQVLWKNPGLQSGFLLGMLALGLATFSMIRDILPGMDLGIAHWLGLVTAFLCFGMLMYVLFLALPFRETYIQQEQGLKNQVYDRGWYGVCRHPGFLFFAGGYVSLGFVLGSLQTSITVAVLILLNFLYILLQDHWTFPRILDGYESYRQRIPFLIPTKASMQSLGSGPNFIGGNKHEV
jgi:protein-S-isoprenylcysteine O-methyltransferase Ste14